MSRRTSIFRKLSSVFIAFILLAASSAAKEAPSTTVSQASSVTWAYKYSYEDEFSTGRNGFTSLTETADRGYLVSGGNLLVKLDEFGQALWEKKYYCGPCRFQAMVEAFGGGYLTANVWDSLRNSYIFVYRLDALGNVVWERIFKRKRFDRVLAVINTRDGGYLLGGFSATVSSGKDGSMWLIKIGGGGKLQWQKTYNVAEATSVAQLSNGDFLVGTRLLSVLRISPGGNVRWQRKYSATERCESGKVVPTPDGGYVLAGENVWSHGSVIIKASPSGTIEFAKLFPRRRFKDIGTTIDKGYVLLTDSNNTYRSIVSKLDSTGNPIWEKLLTDRKHTARQILQSADGGFVIATQQDWILRLDASGSIPGLCRNILAPIHSSVRSIPITVERRFPKVSRTPVRILYSTVNSAVPIRPIVKSICAP